MKKINILARNKKEFIEKSYKILKNTNPIFLISKTLWEDKPTYKQLHNDFLIIWENARKNKWGKFLQE